MKIGFVVPGTGPDGKARCQPLVDGVADLTAELRRRGHEAVVQRLDASWWMVPPASVVEQATALVDTLDDCDAVVDHTGAWATIARRAGARFPVLTRAGDAGLDPSSPAAHRARRAFPGDHGLPAVDPLELVVGAGTGSGGYVLLADERAVTACGGRGRQVEVLPADADRRERAALAADAVAFVAPEGSFGGWLAVEALACATPVVAIEGSPAAEVVTDAVDGVIVPGPMALAEAIERAAALDRWACRHAAWERFSAERRALDIITAVRAMAETPTEASAPTRASPPAAGNGRRELAASAT